MKLSTDKQPITWRWKKTQATAWYSTVSRALYSEGSLLATEAAKQRVKHWTSISPPVWLSENRKLCKAKSPFPNPAYRWARPSVDYIAMCAFVYVWFRWNENTVIQKARFEHLTLFLSTSTSLACLEPLRVPSLLSALLKRLGKNFPNSIQWFPERFGAVFRSKILKIRIFREFYWYWVHRSFEMAYF